MNRPNSCLASIFLLFFVVISSIDAHEQTSAQSKDDELLSGFCTPPNSARPRVWWHWMDGNITPEGILLDLNWMSRIGVGGFTVFEGALDTPQIVKKRLIFMTPPWKEAFKQAIETAGTHGMEAAIASSPGWSETGGPWVIPSQAIKKMVWSETRITGGKRFTGILPQPPRTTGTFQNYDVRKNEQSADHSAKTKPLPEFYADSAVIAYRLPVGEETQPELNPKVTSSGGSIDLRALSDGDVDKVALTLPSIAPGKEAWIEFDYAHPQKIQAITLATLDDMISVFGFPSDAVLPRLEASDDGEHFHKIADIPPSSVPQRTTAFPAVTARYFKITFTTPAGEPVRDHKITELVLSSGARVNQFEKRAGYANVPDFYAIPNPDTAPESVVSLKDIIDLSSKMKPDGSLNWTPPEGEWKVLRIGYSLTGHENGPAPAEATGLEVDKLNRQFVKNYLDSYLKMYSDTVGPSLIGKSGITLMLTDSIEVGPQNWTDDILGEFQRRRGYDPRPWLPALTGVVIESQVDSDRFLWDFRRTIAQLIAQNHYGEVADELHRRGMHYYGEALEYHRPSLGDDMEMRTKTDIPMGAMWTYSETDGPQPTYVADLRGAASIAHIYGQNLVGAESMTSAGPAWSWYPGNLKRIADLQLALGVNRFMIHESTHEPLVDQPPGLTLGIAGQFFTRNETWAKEARPWISYLARSSYLLQQGHFYADVAYFYGEEGPLTSVFGYAPQQDAPQGYGFDFVNSDVILNHLALKDGRLVTPGGTSYRILYLGGTSRRMTLPVLRRLEELVAQGAVIVGNKPVDSPSLSDDQATFQKTADELWGTGSGSACSFHAYGKGRVYSGKTANEVLADLQVSPDYEYTRPEPDTTTMFLHRRLSDGDLYFVINRKDRPESFDAVFRVEGKSPELWDAATGLAKPASYRISDGRTTVPLRLDPYGSIFVVFRKPAAELSRQVPAPFETVVAGSGEILNQGWDVHFQPHRGAPESLRFDHLSSWSDSPNPGVKYFSGTAAYTKTIDAPSAWFKPGAHLWLDLGDVRSIAEVLVNGRSVGIAWKTPYKIDLGNTLKPGSNQLTIKVTNQWVNRIIGDQQPGVVQKHTSTDIQPYDAHSPLLPSGLLGPIQLSSITTRWRINPNVP